jgi:hypothetical protein
VDAVPIVLKRHVNKYPNQNVTQFDCRFTKTIYRSRHLLQSMISQQYRHSLNSYEGYQTMWMSIYNISNIAINTRKWII